MGSDSYRILGNIFREILNTKRDSRIKMPEAEMDHAPKAEA